MSECKHAKNEQVIFCSQCLTEERDALKAEVERLTDLLSNEPQLTDIKVEAGQIDLAVRTKSTRILSELARVFFVGNDAAPNYVEWQFSHPDVGSMIVRVQKANGKTPHQLREAAEKELANARNAALEEAAKVCDENARVMREKCVEYGRYGNSPDHAMCHEADAFCIRALKKGGA